MSSNPIYVVYHITYSGNLLPPNYIGSTSIKQIETGYMGSVCSKNYKDIWKQELKEHPELFHLEIISYHDTRLEAIYKELQIQKLFNVVKNPLFVNMAYATVNGFFGRDVSGKNSSNYGKIYTQEQNLKNSNRIKQVWSNPNSAYHTTEYKNKKLDQNCHLKYKITLPNGNVQEINNLRRFCREQNLIRENMIKVAKGKQTNHKGYKCQYI